MQTNIYQEIEATKLLDEPVLSRDMKVKMLQYATVFLPIDLEHVIAIAEYRLGDIPMEIRWLIRNTKHLGFEKLRDRLTLIIPPNDNHYNYAREEACVYKRFLDKLNPEELYFWGTLKHDNMRLCMLSVMKPAGSGE